MIKIKNDEKDNKNDKMLMIKKQYYACQVMQSWVATVYLKSIGN